MADDLVRTPGLKAELVQILELIRERPRLTRPEIAEHTGFGRKVVSQQVDELVRAEIVIETQSAPHGRGRPASQLSFNPDVGRVLVAELGAGGLVAGVSDLDGTILAWTEDPTPVSSGPEVVLARLEQLWDGLVPSASFEDVPLLAIGVGVRGPVDPANGRTIEVHTAEGWGGYELRSRLSHRYDTPAWIENDANMIAVGEYRRRHGAAPKDLTFILLEHGIGAGIISDGRLLRGANGVAGEFGHMKVSDDPTMRCWCGNVGCLNTFASAPALLARGQRLAAEDASGAYEAVDPDLITIEDMVRAAGNGHLPTIAVFTEVARVLGTALANLINLLNPAEVVLGGSVATARDYLRGPLRAAIDATTYSIGGRAVKVTFASTPSHASNHLIGVALTAVDGLLSTDEASGWLANRLRQDPNSD